MPVVFALAVGALAGASLLAAALRRGWAMSSPASIDLLLRQPSPDEVETTLTRDLFAGAVDGGSYRRAVELLASRTDAVPGTLAEYPG